MQDYAFIRRSNKTGIKNVTINNEQATINACFRYCYDEGLVHVQKLKFDVLPAKGSVDRRARATHDQLKNLERGYWKEFEESDFFKQWETCA